MEQINVTVTLCIITRCGSCAVCRCNASNMAGSDVAYTYLHVFAPEVHSPADMSGLVYPMIPLPLTSPAAGTATTSFAESSTADFRFSAEPEMNSKREVNSTSSIADLRSLVDPEVNSKPEVNSTTGAARSPTSTLRSAAVTSSITSREPAEMAVAGVSALCLLVLILLGIAALVVRRRRRSGKYDPSRATSSAPAAGRRLCGSCWPAADSRGVASVLPAASREFDASTARLKLDTSALSAATDGVVLTNRVTTCPDPVQQTLIGPPSTNDAQSRYDV